MASLSSTTTLPLVVDKAGPEVAESSQVAQLATDKFKEEKESGEDESEGDDGDDDEAEKPQTTGKPKTAHRQAKEAEMRRFKREKKREALQMERQTGSIPVRPRKTPISQWGRGQQAYPSASQTHQSQESANAPFGGHRHSSRPEQSQQGKKRKLVKEGEGGAEDENVESQPKCRKGRQERQ